MWGRFRSGCVMLMHGTTASEMLTDTRIDYLLMQKLRRSKHLLA